MDDSVKTETIGNLEIDRNEGVVKVAVNPKIYNLSVIYGAAHAFTRDNYVLIDGDAEIEIIIELKPIQTTNLEELGRKFCNRLLSYQVHRQKMKENETIRNLILYKALATNSAVSIESKDREEKENEPGKENDCKRQ